MYACVSLYDCACGCMCVCGYVSVREVRFFFGFRRRTGNCKQYNAARVAYKISPVNKWRTLAIVLECNFISIVYTNGIYT